VAPVGGLNASEQHPLQTASGFSDSAVLNVGKRLRLSNFLAISLLMQTGQLNHGTGKFID
jgi:hypothetical protein